MEATCNHPHPIMARIWKKNVGADQLNAKRSGTMLDHLDIVFTDIGERHLSATMPVDHRTIQPLGLLHGGASVVLAETVGSTAAMLCVDTDTRYCVGLEINANHVRSVRSGHVTGTARPVHLGRSTQVWRIDIRDDQERLVAMSRLTMAVLKK